MFACVHAQLLCRRSRSSAKACASKKRNREVAFNAQHALCKRARVLKNAGRVRLLVCLTFR